MSQSVLVKRCPAWDHKGPRKLPLSDFYFNAKHSDNLGAYCKTCAKRHATADQSRRRAARKAQGLPSDERAYKRMIVNQRLVAVAERNAD